MLHQDFQLQKLEKHLGNCSKTCVHQHVLVTSTPDHPFRPASSSAVLEQGLPTSHEPRLAATNPLSLGISCGTFSHTSSCIFLTPKGMGHVFKFVFVHNLLSLGSAAWAVALQSGSAVLCRRPSHLWL